MSVFVAAFPGLHSTLEDLVTERDIVAGRMTTASTHQGEFMGIPATNKKVTPSAMHIIRVFNGKLVDQWGDKRQHELDAATGRATYWVIKGLNQHCSRYRRWV